MRIRRLKEDKAAGVTRWLLLFLDSAFHRGEVWHESPTSRRVERWRGEQGAHRQASVVAESSCSRPYPDGAEERDGCPSGVGGKVRQSGSRRPVWWLGFDGLGLAHPSPDTIFFIFLMASQLLIQMMSSGCHREWKSNGGSSIHHWARSLSSDASLVAESNLPL